MRKIDELQIPSPDLKEMQNPVKASVYRRMVGEMILRRNGLILQLYRLDPGHPRTVPLMRERWAKFEARDRGAPTDYIARVLTDIDRVLADRPTRMIRILGETARINVRLENMPRGSWVGAGDAIAEFFKRYPANPEGVNVVLNWVYRLEGETKATACRTFLKKTGYDWPQFYQGNAWSSEFSAGWGVMAIPELFLIDRRGVLRETGVIDLESSLKKLLAEPS